MPVYPLHYELIEIQGYVTLAAYFHYFTPGSLKISTKIHTVKLYKVVDFINNSLETRRWLPSGESPYPGYCRAPGSDQCLPVLCNCDKLTDIYKKIQLAKLKIKKEQG